MEIIALYTDINGIELNQDREPFVGTLENHGQGYQVKVLKEHTKMINDVVHVSEKAMFLTIEEC